MATPNPASPPPSPTSLPLLDRVAIVTGASRGIGKAIAHHLATLGARIIINYNSNPTAAASLAASINSSPPHPSLSLPRAVAVHCDVSNPDHVKTLFDAATHSFHVPSPHILVTSAGVNDATYSSLADTPAEDFDRIFAVNARGTFLCMKEAAGRVARGGGGRIVTVSSSMVGVCKQGYGAYAASKAAVEAMTRTMAKEMKGTGVTVNCVAPGPVATDMYFAGKTEEDVRRMVEITPLGRLGETEDIAPVVGFLVSDAAEWVNGQVIRVNGGYV